MNPDRPTTEEVWRMLEAVIDPELHSSVVDLGMVRDVSVDEDGLISVEIALTIASCPLRSQIEGDVESRLGSRRRCPRRRYLGFLRPPDARRERPPRRDRREDPPQRSQGALGAARR